MLQRKLQNVFMINVFVFVGLLLMVSNCLAQNGTWTPQANIPTPRMEAASCELNGKIYVIGGTQDLYSSLDIMEVYDPATNTWDTTKAPMPTARVQLCVAAVDGKIYAIGGTQSHNGGTSLGMVEVYDPATNNWTTKASMETPRKGAACGVINNLIYVAGGAASGYTGSTILEVYDPVEDNWTPRTNMLAARYGPVGAVLNDTFYVSGGLIGSPWTGQTAVQKYDPINNSWSYGTNLLYGRVGHTTNDVNGRIYAIGGDTQPPIVENVEEYDPQTKTWTEIDPTPSGMVCHTASVFGNKIYVFSGSTTYIFPPTLTNNVYSYTPPQPASANFIADTTYGDLPLTVHFTDNSAGTITAWLWDFGDDSSSTEQNPTHTYNIADTFSVSLTVTGPLNSDSLFRENYIIVNDTTTPPQPASANFIADTTYGDLPLTVHFTDNSTGTITAWLWSFGDDSTSTEQNPTHTYNIADTFSVSLTVTGPLNSDSLFRENYIIVEDPSTVHNLSDALPTEFKLFNNYPNPFNPSTIIKFSLPKAEFVTLKIYNLLGQELSTLVSEKINSGKYQYNWNAGSLASGVYLYRLQAGEYVKTKKLILVR